MPEQINSTIYRSPRRMSSGFTIIELLVAVAITIVLLTLLFGPLVQSFFFTGQAQAEATAQSTARTTMEQISRELGSAAGMRDTEGKFLNMMVMKQDGTETLARSYNAYMDIVPPRAQKGTQYDPTASSDNRILNPPASLNNVNINPNTGAEETPPLILSLAPGTGFTRYFLGLKYPISLLFDPNNPGANNEQQPYYNPYDETNAQIRAMKQNFNGSYVTKNDLTNTYILYRAEVQPRIPEVDANGNPITVNNNLVYVPNWHLFSSVYGPGDQLGTPGQPEPDGQAQADPQAQPVLDDPDFFRVVTTNDINPITGMVYTAPQANDHNMHVYNWTKVGKPVVAAPVADLIAPPRDARGNVQYDAITLAPTHTFDPASNPNGNPIPVMPTTVSFGPALISNDTLTATTNQYASQGFGSSQIDVAPPAGAPYIPSIYKAAFGQWQGAPVFTLYENDLNNNPIQQTGAAAAAANGTPFYITGLATPSDIAANLSNNANLNRSNATNPAQGDLIEYDSETLDPITNLPNHPVYDISKNSLFQGVAHYTALSFDPTSGAANFAITAQPTNNGAAYDYRDPNDPNGSPFWNVNVIPAGTANGNQQGLFFDGTNNTVQFQALTGSYLNSNDANFVPGAQIVANSDRVYGPDMSYGGTNLPNSTPPLVPYTRVTSQASAQLQANQYAVNYATGTFYFALPSPGGQGPSNTSNPLPKVQIAFSYQNNLNDTTGPFTADTVRATYNTGSLTQIALGIRLYDTNSGRPAFFSLNNRLSVGNARR